ENATSRPKHDLGDHGRDGRGSPIDRGPGQPRKHPQGADPGTGGRISRLIPERGKDIMSTAFPTQEKQETTKDGPAVLCRDTTKDFGAGEARVHALRGVTLEVRPGEVTLLVGPSGCGKTTLISIIAGLLDPSEGEIRILGQDLRALDGRARVRF